MDQATQDALNNLNASIDAATTRVQATQAEVKDLRDTVAKLQAQIDAGNADPALVDALNAAKARLDQLDVNNDAPLPEDVTPLAVAKP
jgi:predicted  nucleic acid-binding Zn-ribbon protein